jgi:hypothetical protein
VPLVSRAKDRLVRNVLSLSSAPCLYYRDRVGQLVWCEIIHSPSNSGRDKQRQKERFNVRFICDGVPAHFKWHRSLRKLETSDWDFSKLCFIKHNINLSLYPEYVVQEVVSKPRLSPINIIHDYKKNVLEKWGLLLHIQKNVALHLSTCFIWVHEKFVWAHVIIDFESRSSRLESGNTARLLLVSTVSAAKPPTSRDKNPATILCFCTSESSKMSEIIPHNSGKWNQNS